MARKGTFGAGLTQPITDLSAYQIGVPLAKPVVTGTYTPAHPPPRTTVAPEVGILPQPVIPKVVSPYVTLKAERAAIAARGTATTGTAPTASAVTSTQLKYSSATLLAEREAIRLRAIATGHTPTESDITATLLKNMAGY